MSTKRQSKDDKNHTKTNKQNKVYFDFTYT